LVRRSWGLRALKLGRDGTNELVRLTHTLYTNTWYQKHCVSGQKCINYDNNGT